MVLKSQSSSTGKSQNAQTVFAIFTPYERERYNAAAHFWTEATKLH
jgi:hypothetical protein